MNNCRDLGHFGFRRRALVGILLLALGRAGGEVLVQIGQNFTGSTYLSDSPYVPPDCNGAAGPLHYVEMINGRFSVYTKTNGVRVQTMTTSAFWNNAGVTFDSGLEVSDPRLIYDPAAGRWFAASIDFNPSNESSNRFLIAVSTTPDPTVAWKGLAFTADPVAGNFADFPTLGLDANGVYVAGYMFDGVSALEIGNTLASIPKSDLLLPVPTVANRHWFGILGFDYGSVLQPAISLGASSGGANVLAVGDLGYDFLPHSTLIGFNVLNAAGPGTPLLTTPATINVEPYSVPINPAQPDFSNNLDDGDARFSSSISQVGGVLYATHGVEVDGRAAVRWYRINASNLAVLESGTIADAALEFFYPSIAANAAGVVVIGFNGCNSSTFISSFAAVGETVGGTTTFGPPLLLTSGLASYQHVSNGSSRWGDYSTTCVDPIDPNRFWTIQEFPSGPSAWSTQITEVRTAIPRLVLAASATNAVLSWPGTAITFALESSDSLSAPGWTTVSEPQTAENGVVSVILPKNGISKFFRLHKL